MTSEIDRELKRRIEIDRMRRTKSRTTLAWDNETQTLQLTASHIVIVRHATLKWPSQLNAYNNYNALLVPAFYFMLGLYLELPSLSIQYYAENVLHIGPSMLSTVTGFIMMPWFVKPVFGLVSDAVPLYNYHRRPYLQIFSFGALLAWLAVSVTGVHATSTAFFGMCMFFSNFFICGCDVMVDCMLAARARDEMARGQRGHTQSMAWSLRLFGTLVGSWLGGLLLRHARRIQLVFFIVACLTAVIFAASFWLYEQPALSPYNFASTGGNGVRMSPWAEIRTRLRHARDEQRERPTVLRLASFIFIFAATPNTSQAFFYFLTNHLQFTKMTMSILSILTVVGGLLSLALYRFALRELHTTSLIRVGIVVGTALSFVQLMLITGVNRRLGISDFWFALGDDFADGVASQLCVSPLLIVAAAVCPTGDEGLLYAGLMSVSNFGGAVSTWIGAALTKMFGVTATNFRYMWALCLVCSLLNVLPLFYAHYVPSEAEIKHDADAVAAARKEKVVDVSQGEMQV